MTTGLVSRTDAILAALDVALGRARAALDAGDDLRAVRLVVRFARGHGRPRAVIVATERAIIADEHPGRASGAGGTAL